MIARNGVLLIALIVAITWPGATIQGQERKETSREPTSFTEVRKEMRDLLATLKDYSADERDKAVERANEVLTEIDHRIETLEADINRNAHTMGDKKRETVRQSMKELRQQRIKAAEWFGSLKTSSVIAWDQIKQDVIDAYRDFIDTWENAEQDLAAALETNRQ